MGWVLLLVLLIGVGLGAEITHYLCKDDYRLGYMQGKEDAEVQNGDVELYNTD